MDEIPAAFEAAAAILATRNRAQTRGQKPLSVRAAAVRFNASPSAVQRAISSLQSPDPIPRWPGRPRALTNEEDEALVAFVLWLQRGGFPATKSQLVGAANDLRRRRDPEIGDLGKMWYSRWLLDHPEVQKTHIKAIKKSRKSFEASNVENLMTFFDNLKNIINDYRIGASECWNEDECGIRLGCLRERIQVLVVRTTRSQRPGVLDPSNRESSTLIGTVNAAGDSIPPWLIFKTFPTEAWAEVDADSSIHFARSETGFSNSQITLEWLHHFNLWSWRKSAQAQRSGQTLEGWFGCNVWLRDPATPWAPPFDLPPVQRPKEEKIYRLLVIDGFTGHTTLDFIEYCIKFDIIVAVFPSHSTHILQPLDVGVFQPLKNSHQKFLRKSLFEGNLGFSRMDFIASFQAIYDEGFTRHNIISGFEKTGIFPPNAQPAVMRVFSEKQKQREAINPAFSSLLPKETRFHQASTSIYQAREKYGDLMSSPTREGLRQASLVVTEACTLEKHVNNFIVDRNRRIERLGSRRKRGSLVRPTGDFHTAVSLDQIRQQDQKSRKANKDKMMKAQLREGRRVVRLEMERLKNLWRADRAERQISKQKVLTFKAWLQHTGKGDEFLFLEVQNKEFADLLGYNNDAFFIDTTGQRSQHVEEVIQRALTKPHILEQMSECSWGAGSNSSIDITMGPFNDQNDDQNKATQEETQETTQDYTKETIFDLTGDVSSEDEFLSLPPSSPTLPALKTPSKMPSKTPSTGRWKEISKIIEEYKKTRNS
jgi:DDE superfamily endonuclease